YPCSARRVRAVRRRWQAPRRSLPRTYEPRLGPPLVQAFATSWGLSEPLTRRWWQALCEARWSEAVVFREAVIHFIPERDGARDIVHTTCSPHGLVSVLEALVEEGVLSR